MLAVISGRCSAPLQIPACAGQPVRRPKAAHHLARLFLQDLPILILDEATSALDTISERKVQQAIGTASRDRTVILVAQRLSTFADADRILVLDDGRIAETGTYAELIARDGLFAELARCSELNSADCQHSPVPA